MQGSFDAAFAELDGGGEELSHLRHKTVHDRQMAHRALRSPRRMSLEKTKAIEEARRRLSQATTATSKKKKTRKSSKLHKKHKEQGYHEERPQHLLPLVIPPYVSKPAHEETIIEDSIKEESDQDLKKMKRSDESGVSLAYSSSSSSPSSYTSAMLPAPPANSEREDLLAEAEERSILEHKRQQQQDRQGSIMHLQKSFNEDIKEPIPVSILYGLINVAIVLPVIMSFGTIIYSDKAYAAYLPVLVKLTMISGAVHQFCFSISSSLPFAIGQVQDAGLIFLSSMAGRIVDQCRAKAEAGGVCTDEHMLATATIILPLCTAVLGVALIVVGKLKLASHVQNLPTPVVGGYLAFIGFFCGQSGLGLMANVNVDGLLEWYKFFQDRDTLMHLLPGLAGGLVIYVLVRELRHMAVLPTCIVGLVVIFYATLSITGKTVEEAREHGWVNEGEPPPVWYKTWDYLQFNLVMWDIIPSITFTLLSMIFVVALSSSLDVAAIELELGRPLDYDHEIRTVGWSNIISGCTGGYTGSYIFSQSIFSLRAGIRTRVNGLVVAICEVVFVILPFSVLSYVPNFFFGSLLVMIAVDLMVEWLWDVRNKMTLTEYGLNLSSFVLIQCLGVEYGILAGLAVYLMCRQLGMDVGAMDEDDEDDMGRGNNVGGKMMQENQANDVEKLMPSEDALLLIDAIQQKEEHRNGTVSYGTLRQ